MADQYMRVVVEQFFIIPPDATKDEEKLEYIVDDWFNDWNLNASHAARDNRQIGGADRCLSVERMTEEEFSKHIHTRGEIDLSLE